MNHQIKNHPLNTDFQCFYNDNVCVKPLIFNPVIITTFALKILTLHLHYL